MNSPQDWVYIVLEPTTAAPVLRIVLNLSAYPKVVSLLKALPQIIQSSGFHQDTVKAGVIIQPSVLVLKKYSVCKLLIYLCNWP